MPPRDASATATAKSVDAEESLLHAVVIGDAPPSRLRWGPLLRGNNGEDAEDDLGSSMHSDDRSAGPSTRASISRHDEPLPWCLVPLAGASLLAWTLESLASAGVRVAHVYVKHGTEAVRAYVRSSPFARGSLKVIVRGTTSETEGGVMQEADGLGIPGDFLLVRVGYVGNVDLAEAMRRFDEKKKIDKVLLMDSLLAPVRSLASSHTTVYTLAGPNNQILAYQTGTRYPRKRRVTVPRNLVAKGIGRASGGISLRTDLESIGIDICSNGVAPLFSENFDYKAVRPELIQGVLFHEDIIQRPLSVSIIDRPKTQVGRAPQWAIFVKDPATYQQATEAVLSRLTYPLTPDENLPGTEARYERRRDRVFVAPNVDLHRTADVRFSLLGSRVQIGYSSEVASSVLGSSVLVGAHCAINNSYISERVRIGDNCTIEHALIGAGAVLGPGTILQRGAVVGPGVVLGPNARVSGQVSSEEATFDGPTSNDTLGAGAKAYAWPVESRWTEDDVEDSDDEEGAQRARLRNIALSRIGAKASDLSPSASAASSASSVVSDEDSDDDAHDVGSLTDDEGPKIAGLSLLSDSAELPAVPVEEIRAQLDRSFAADDHVDNVVLELMNIRLTNPQATMDRLRDIVVAYICEHAPVPTPLPPVRQLYGPLSAHVHRWVELVKRLDTKTRRDMVSVAHSIQAYASTSAHPALCWLFMRAFYEAEEFEVLDEDALIAWSTDRQSVTLANEHGAAGATARNGAISYVKTLMEASDEESD